MCVCVGGGGGDSLSQNVVWWLILEEGTKKINLGPGLYSLKFAVSFVRTLLYLSVDQIRGVNC